MGHRKGVPAVNKGMPHWTDADYLAKIKSKCVIQPNGCWLWTGSTVTDGYGEFSYRGKAWRLHRLMYFLLNGPIPDRMVVMHSCDVRHCTNPAHLSLGSQRANILDALAKDRPHRGALMRSKTHCPQGHAYAEHGRIHPGRDGEPWRACKLCQLGKSRKRAGWPESHWYIPAQPQGVRPSFDKGNES